MSGPTNKDREIDKITILVHNGLTSVLNELEPSDYPYITTNSNSMFLENLYFDYFKFIDQFKTLNKDSNRKLTIYDKALCLAMALKRNPVISLSSNYKGRKPKRVMDLQERVIAYIVVDFMHAANYTVLRANISDNMDLRVFDNGHKKELNGYRALLTEEFKTANFDYAKCLALLAKVFTRSVLYQNGLDLELESTISQKLSIRDNVRAHGVTIASNEGYAEYKKSRRF